MSATIVLKGGELEAHAKNCAEANIALAGHRAFELGKNKLVGGRALGTELNELLRTTDHMLSRYKPPASCWQRDLIISIVREVCGGRIELERNGAERDPMHGILCLRQSQDGATIVGQLREPNLHLFMPEVMLGLLLQVATVIAFDRMLMQTYDLSRMQVQTLVTRNRRTEVLYAEMIGGLVAHNVGAWLGEYPQLERFGHPLTAKAPAASFMALRPACSDLPLYVPSGTHTGERIDLFAVLGTCPSNDAFRTLVGRLRRLGTTEALAPLYNLETLATPSLAPPPPVTESEATAPSPSP